MTSVITDSGNNGERFKRRGRQSNGNGTQEEDNNRLLFSLTQCMHLAYMCLCVFVVCVCVCMGFFFFFV